jgi:Zn-dependent protease with chaperone function
VPAATAREHGRKRLLLKSEDESACFASGNRSRTVLSRGLAERLAVGEIAEIIVHDSTERKVGMSKLSKEFIQNY